MFYKSIYKRATLVSQQPGDTQLFYWLTEQFKTKNAAVQPLRRVQSAPKSMPQERDACSK